MVMAAMNILYINHYAGSPSMGMEFRTYYLSKEWKNMGHSVVIVAGDYSHLRIKNPVVGKDFAEENVDGVDYCWVQTGKYDGNGAKRAFSMFRFVYKLYVNAKMLVDRYTPDVVVTSSTYPIDTFAGQRIARLAGAKLIHEIHDMWPETLVQIGNMSRLHPFVMLMQWGENSFCRNADAVVSLPPCAGKYLAAHGMREEKFYRTCNGFCAEEWLAKSDDIPQEHEELLARLKKENKFILGYAGGHAVSNALIYLLRAAELLTRKDIAIVLVGKGQEKENLQSYVAEHGLDNVWFLPAVAREQIPKLLSYMDALYIGWSNCDLYRAFGISPNKLIDYMMSGKPILNSGEAGNNPVEEAACGISVKPEEPVSIAGGILQFADMSADERVAMGRHGRKYAMEHFDYRVIAKNFADIMNDVVRK